MTAELIAGFHRQLERLESENRKLRVVASVALLGVVGALLVGRAAAGGGARVVEAEQFLLRDPNGVLRAALKTAGNGPVSLALADTEGQTRMLLSVDKDGLQDVSFFDEKEKPRAVLAVLGEGVDWAHTV